MYKIHVDLRRNLYCFFILLLWLFSPHRSPCCKLSSYTPSLLAGSQLVRLTDVPECKYISAVNEDGQKKVPLAHHNCLGDASLTCSCCCTRAKMMCRLLLQNSISQTEPCSQRLPCQHLRSSCWIMQHQVCSFWLTLSFCLCMSCSSSIEPAATPSTC